MVRGVFSQVDAFTDQPYRGNPAAVFLLPGPALAPWMQAVAAEMNLSETAFTWTQAGRRSLRWFTPAVEVPLCGHATLAASHVLWEEGLAGPDETLLFSTRSGLLKARRQGAWIELDFPALRRRKASAPPGLGRALGAEPRYVARAPGTVLVEVGSEKVLRSLKPDFKTLARMHRGAFIVTAASSSPDFDFVSRCFAPGEGIDEDPVTGSAHCCLGPFWAERLGRGELKAFQASARGGVVRVRTAGGRVLLYGKAVTVFKGRLTPRALSQG
ncbi:MAG: PhzF family phenazine biosynthesis protein [Elusimicrobia bacterium]|nr:PhzF family phenazine biosynthesis protein [Elusimicrobiota bacterium]